MNFPEIQSISLLTTKNMLQPPLFCVPSSMKLRKLILKKPLPWNCPANHHHWPCVKSLPLSPKFCFRRNQSKEWAITMFICLWFFNPSSAGTAFAFNFCAWMAVKWSLNTCDLIRPINAYTWWAEHYLTVAEFLVRILCLRNPQGNLLLEVSGNTISSDTRISAWDH